MRALYIIVPVLAILVIAYRYYCAFIAAKVWSSTTTASRRRTRRTTAQNYVPTNKLGALRPSLRGDRRRRAADRPGARGAVRLPAGFAVAPRRRRASPARCTTSSSCRRRSRRGGTSLAEIARTEIGPRRRRHGGHRDPLHRHHRAGRPRHRRRQRARRERVGHVHRSFSRSRSRSSWASTCTGCAHGRDPRGDDRRRDRLLLAAVVVGRIVADSSLGAIFTLSQARRSRSRWRVYGFIASVLPVWMLLCPRDYLSRS